ncbi:head-tail adaptor protein [Bacillus manliponensis]|uniref:head-tail adaptor protein n=1 Tax=Bacillus manliponensis TaxID=574376 RepID=UPI003513ADFD
MSVDKRHRIDIYGNVKKINELEETEYKFEKIKTIWAAIIPQTATLQRQQADTMLTNVTHKIIVRFSAGKDITKDMQIHFKHPITGYVHKFEIKYPLNPFFVNEDIEIFCQELME